MTPSASPHADLDDEGTGCHGIRSLCACLAAEVDLSTDGFFGLAFTCSDADQVFTLTVEGADQTVSETIAITRELG